MQNIWLVGLVLTGLIGTGAVMGMGAMDHHNGMHNMMQGEHYEECYEHEYCEHHEENCPEHGEEECYEGHEYCEEDGYHHREEHEGHGCW